MALKDLIRKVKATADKVGEPDSIVQTLDTHLLRAARAPKFDPDWHDKDVFHPSEVSSGLCPRFKALAHLSKPESKGGAGASLLGGKDYPDPRLMRIFNMGHGVHWMYQHKVLGPAGLLWGKWVPGETALMDALVMGKMPEPVIGFMPGPDWTYVEPAMWNEEYNIGGHCDGIIVLEDGSTALVEVKSINDRGFGFLQEPKVTHARQLQLYLSGVPTNLTVDGTFNPGWPKEIQKPTGGWNIYVNKNTSVEKHYWSNTNPEVLAGLYARIDEYREALAKEELPVRIPECKTPRSERAKRCQGVSACWELGAGRQGWVEASGVRGCDE